MKKVLAVSGGMDSMVLLDWFYDDPDGAVVAHFDHGTRPSSKDDAEFVRRKAKEYGLKFYLGHGNLGENVSEEKAREARYKFLREVAQKEGGAIICTAHHVNDLIETIAINILRGTGWRGLTPFYMEGVFCPFIHGEHPLSKTDIYEFNVSDDLTFREDPTNSDTRYLRNRLRKKLYDYCTIIEMRKMLSLHEEQLRLRAEIEGLAEEILPEDGTYQRSWFMKMDDKVALELLRTILKRRGISATRPQLKNFLKAVREYASRKMFNLPGGKFATIYKTFFVVE